MATDATERAALRFIKKWGDEVDAFNQNLARQDNRELSNRIMDVIDRKARAAIKKARSEPERSDEIMALQCAVVKNYALILMVAEKLHADRRAAAGHTFIDAPEDRVADTAPEKELKDCGPVESYVPPGVNHPFWDGADAPPQDKQSGYQVPDGPDLNEVRDEYREQNVPSKGPFCPDKPLIGVSPDTRTVTIDMRKGTVVVQYDGTVATINL